MDWNNLAYFAFVAAFVILMMRRCGGGMCGMGHRGRNNSRTELAPRYSGQLAPDFGVFLTLRPARHIM